MNINLFDFDLPEELIAQTPSEKRSESRLLVMDGKELYDRHFYNIVDYFDKGDVLVLNDTRVLAARLFGVKEITHAKVEVLILEIKDDVAKALVGNAKVVKKGTVVSFGEGKLKAKCIEVKPEGIRIFELIYEGIFLEILDELGEMPLPPYIHEPLDDKERYQTVYAEHAGAVAAPTAGLHFDDQLLASIAELGVDTAFVTLHVGAGTFQPVRVETLEEHQMHHEWLQVSQEVVDAVAACKARGGRVIAVGTTSVRSLESAAQATGELQAFAGETDIFLYPGRSFNVVDALVTNFHLSESTLLMLVAAFAGYPEIMDAYRSAVEQKYRFFSYGDAMFITRNPQPRSPKE